MVYLAYTGPSGIVNEPASTVLACAGSGMIVAPVFSLSVLITGPATWENTSCTALRAASSSSTPSRPMDAEANFSASSALITYP